MVGACDEKRWQQIEQTNIPHKRNRKIKEKDRHTEEVRTAAEKNRSKMEDVKDKVSDTEGWKEIRKKAT